MNSIDRLADSLAGLGIACLRGELMSRHTTFMVGGAASIFIEPADVGQIAAVQRLCRELEIKLLPLGRGSNMLVADEGLPFAVLHLGESYSGITRLSENSIEVLSGTKLSAVCRHTATEGLSGLEWGYGIPGNIGGVVYMNAGAYGGEMKDIIVSVHFLDEDGQECTLSGDELEFSYRHSVFSGRGCIILSATMEFTHDDPQAIKAAMDNYMERRREKQPLEFGSAGSTFKRPEGAFAAALIDQCRLKGFAVGDAAVSDKHAGFVINRGKASCADVLAVMSHVSTVVKESTGYLLEPEIMILP